MPALFGDWSVWDIVIFGCGVAILAIIGLRVRDPLLELSVVDTSTTWVRGVPAMLAGPGCAIVGAAHGGHRHTGRAAGIVRAPSVTVPSTQRRSVGSVRTRIGVNAAVASRSEVRCAVVLSAGAAAG